MSISRGSAIPNGHFIHFFFEKFHVNYDTAGKIALLNRYFLFAQKACHLPQPNMHA